MNSLPLSGTQLQIRSGDQVATIADVGAHLREYRVGDREVIAPFDADELPPASHGSVLAPWPNRVGDGAYRYDGVEHQLAITEVPRMNAIHGLVKAHRWIVAAHDDDAVTLTLRLPATRGYPFDLGFTATYRLAATGLQVEVVATNYGAKPAPYGIGFHPWLSAAGADLDECTVQVDAGTRILLDDRLLAVGREPVNGESDLRFPRSLRGLDLDDAWVDAIRDTAGLSWVRLGCPDGTTVGVWMDETMDAWQLCTGDHITSVNRSALAVEPMSCVANAFNTGDRLVHLGPGETHTARWGCALLN